MGGRGRPGQSREGGAPPSPAVSTQTLACRARTPLPLPRCSPLPFPPMLSVLRLSRTQVQSHRPPPAPPYNVREKVQCPTCGSLGLRHPLSHSPNNPHSPSTSSVCCLSNATQAFGLGPWPVLGPMPGMRICLLHPISPIPELHLQYYSV